ncbi:glycosyltransferase [Vibrio vulnificus]|nr:glycosyltransferase family 1 protein [Vibrio vulnificus]
MMKVGIVTTWFERGAAYVSKQFKEALEKSGYQVFIYSRGGEDLTEVKGLEWRGNEVYEGKKVHFPESTYIDLNDFECWLLDNNIDTVLFNEQRWLPPVLLCKKIGIRSGAYIDYYTKETVSSFKFYDFLICNTKRHQSVFDWHEQCFFIPWGTDTSLFSGKERVESNILRFFTSVGMNPDRKGLDLTVKAYIDFIGDRDLQSKLIIHSQLDVSQFLKARLTESEYFKYSELVNSNDISVKIETVTAPGLYHIGDIYVYPSRLEGIGLTIAEALSSGMPAIVPDEAPMNEYLCPNSFAVEVERRFKRYDGYYWESNEVSVKSLSKSFSRYYDIKTKIVKMQNETREYSVENLTWNDRVPDIAKAFETSKIMSGDISDWRSYNNKFNKHFPYLSQLQIIYKAIWFFARSRFFSALR